MSRHQKAGPKTNVQTMQKKRKPRHKNLSKSHSQILVEKYIEYKKNWHRILQDSVIRKIATENGYSEGVFT